MTSYVPGLGPKDAKIVILGEAPGAAEAQRGEPFIGPSGKLLTQLLAQAGINRKDQCYVTNVVKEQPLNNDITPFIDLTHKKEKISDKGEYYLRALQQELSGLKPNVIVPTGNVGLFALTGKRGITNWRGSVLSGEHGEKVIPTLHPAAALRQYILRYYILNDLRRVEFHSHFPEVPQDNREYILEPLYADCMMFLELCLESELVAFDIEVSRGEVSCISFARSKDEAISIPFYDKAGDYFNLERETKIWLKIAELLENPNVRKLGHNTSFDSTFLYRKYGIASVNLEDTMIAQGILHPDFRKGLAYVTSWYTSVAYYKDEGKSKFKAQNDEVFWRYNARDSIVLMEAFPKMEKALKQRGLWDTYRSQCELINPLIYMTEHGLKIDHASIKASSDKLDEEIQLLRYEITQLADDPNLNPASPSQLVDYFYHRIGIKPYKSRKSGRPTVDEKALKRLSRLDAPKYLEAAQVAHKLLRLREISKLKSTYLDVKLDPKDHRLRGSFNPIGTKTLRLSSSADIFGVGTNLQNLPPRMKENIVPDTDCLGFEVDLAQAENRVVAYLGPEPRMIEAFEQGSDIHSRTASYIFQKDEYEIKELNREWDAAGKPTDPRYCPTIGHGNKPFRYWGKEANHAFNYGLGYRSAALRWEIPERDARFIYDSYHRIYPGVRQMHRWIKDSLNKTRTVSNLFGYKRQFLDRWDEIVKDAYAFPAQSTVAEIINRYGVKYIYYRSDLFPDITLLNQVHDSVVFQIPLSAGWDTISRYLYLIKASLETPLEFRGKEFSIPAEFTMYPRNFAKGYELDRLTPEALESAYKHFTESVQ